MLLLKKTNNIEGGNFSKMNFKKMIAAVAAAAISVSAFATGASAYSYQEYTGGHWWDAENNKSQSSRTAEVVAYKAKSAGGNMTSAYYIHEDTDSSRSTAAIGNGQFQFSFDMSLKASAYIKLKNAANNSTVLSLKPDDHKGSYKIYKSDNGDNELLTYQVGAGSDATVSSDKTTRTITYSTITLTINTEAKSVTADVVYPNGGTNTKSLANVDGLDTIARIELYAGSDNYGDSWAAVKNLSIKQGTPEHATVTAQGGAYRAYNTDGTLADNAGSNTTIVANNATAAMKAGVTDTLIASKTNSYLVTPNDDTITSITVNHYGVPVAEKGETAVQQTQTLASSNTTVSGNGSITVNVIATAEDTNWDNFKTKLDKMGSAYFEVVVNID